MGGSPFCALFPVQSVFEWGEADNPKAVGSTPKAGDSRLFGVKIS